MFWYFKEGTIPISLAWLTNHIVRVRMCIFDKFWTSISILTRNEYSEDDVDAYFGEISECDSEDSEAS